MSRKQTGGSENMEESDDDINLDLPTKNDMNYMDQYTRNDYAEVTKKI